MCAGHAAAQEAAPVALKAPAAHAVQLREPAGEKVPMGQRPQ